MNEYDQAWVDIKQLMDERASIIASITEIHPTQAELRLYEAVLFKVLEHTYELTLLQRLKIAWRIIRNA